MFSKFYKFINDYKLYQNFLTKMFLNIFSKKKNNLIAVFIQTNKLYLKHAGQDLPEKT